MIKILLAVISREEGATISPWCAMNLTRLAQAQNDDRSDAIIGYVHPCPHDLVRARSRCAEMMYEQDYTHILYWDADVSFPDPANVVANMLAVDEDVVFTAYRKKREPEVEWPFTMIEGPPIKKGHALQIMTCGMGCTLVTRNCISRMRDVSRPFNDKWGGVLRKPRAMFMLRHVGDEMLPEDYSFCMTWREIGGTVWLNMANWGDHNGSHLFEAPQNRGKLVR